MFVLPSMVALTVERIFSWVLMVGIRSHTFERAKVCELFSAQDIEDFSACVCVGMALFTPGIYAHFG